MATKEQEYAIKYLTDNYDLPLYAAQGMIAGVSGESGRNLNGGAYNPNDPNGGSFGIVQWNGSRVKDILNHTGKTKVNEITGEEQLDFMMHELTQGSEKDKFKYIQQAGNAADVTRAMVNKYIRPKQTEVNRAEERVREFLPEITGVSAGDGSYKSNGSTPVTDNSSMTSSEKLAAKYADERAKREQYDSLDSGFKSFLVENGVKAGDDRVDTYKPIYEAQMKHDAQIKAQAEQGLLTHANPVMVWGDNVGRWVEKKFSDDTAAVDARRDSNIREKSRGGMAIASGVSNSLGNAADVLDNTSVGNYLGVDNGTSALKQYSKDTDKLYDDGSTGYKVSKTAGEIAPALMVPMVGGTGVGAIAANTALQAGAAYLMANDEDRNMNAGITGVLTAGIPYVGKGISALGKYGVGGASKLAETAEMAFKPEGNAVARRAGQELIKATADTPSALANLDNYLLNGDKLTQTPGSLDRTAMILNSPGYNRLNEAVTAKIQSGSQIAESTAMNQRAITDTVNPNGLSLSTVAESVAPKVKQAIVDESKGLKQAAQLKYNDVNYKAAEVNSDDVIPALNMKVKEAFTNSAGNLVDAGPLKQIIADITPETARPIKLHELDAARRDMQDKINQAYKTGDGGLGEKMKVVKSALEEILANPKLTNATQLDETAAVTARKEGDKLWREKAIVEESPISKKFTKDSPDADIASAKGLFASDAGRGTVKDATTQKLLDAGKIDKADLTELSKAYIGGKLTGEQGASFNIAQGSKAVNENKTVLKDIWGTDAAGRNVIDTVANDLKLESLARNTLTTGSNTANKMQAFDELAKEVSNQLLAMQIASTSVVGGVDGGVLTTMFAGHIGQTARQTAKENIIMNVAKALDKAGADPKEAARIIAMGRKSPVLKRAADKIVEAGKMIEKINVKRPAAIAGSTGLFDDN